MKERTNQHFEKFYQWHPELIPLQGDILHAAETIINTYRQGGKVLTCGNGGSSGHGGRD